jgi:hypothetical protein
MAKKQSRTQDLIGLNRLGENGVITDAGDETMWFLVQASNLSVLSPEHIGEKIANLAGLLSVLPECEILCVDAQENFDANLRFLEKRIAEEDNQKVRELLRAEKVYLDGIRSGLSSSREFLFAFHLTGREHDSAAMLRRIEKQITEQGFRCKRAEIADYKRILTRYFGWNLPDGEIETTDGENAARKWFLPDGEVVG